MANRIKSNNIVRRIHIYSTFIILGFLLMYIVTGFLITRHNLFINQDPKIVTTNHYLSLPVGISKEELPVYLQKEFNLRGHRGIPQSNNKGEITIFYFRPGLSSEAIIAADKKNVKIETTTSNLRSTVVIFHRMKGYGGGFLYDLYVLMTDLTAVAIIIFSLTGVYLGLYNGKQIFPKLLVLFIGVGYTLLVIFSFMKS